MNAALVYISALLSATVFDATFERANAAYNSGDYAGAVHQYEQLVAEGVVDPAVFYNLGNAYYRSQQLAPAIANYERVLQIDPNFENAAQNLRVCIEQTPRGAARPLPPAWEQSLLFWHYGLSTGASMVGAALCWILAWGILGLRLVRPLPYTRVAAVAVFVLAASFTASVWAKRHPVPIAVAGQAEVPVYFDRDTESPVHFQLLLGDRVTIDDTAPGWLQIVAPGGERGWAERDAFALVGPPYARPPEGLAAGAAPEPESGPAERSI